MEVKGNCLAHPQIKTTHICTYPNCKVMNICAQCISIHQKQHPTSFILTEEQWILSIQRKVKIGQKELHYGNFKAIKSEKYHGSQQAASLSKQLSNHIQRLMKIIAHQQKTLQQNCETRVLVVNKQEYAKVKQHQKNVIFLQKVVNKSGLRQYLPFLYCEKGWSKMRIRFHYLYEMRNSCLEYMKKMPQIQQIIKQIQTGSNSHEILEKLEKIVQDKQMQQAKKPTNTQAVNEKKITQQPKKDKIVSQKKIQQPRKPKIVENTQKNTNNNSSQNGNRNASIQRRPQIKSQQKRKRGIFAKIFG